MNSTTTSIGAAASTTPPSIPSSRHRTWICGAALLAIWLAATAWLRPLAIPDEGRYVGVAWEMLRSGDWLVPTLNGHPFFHKPPLFYWITAASMELFGPGVWAARVASILAATAAATALFAFVRRWAGGPLARDSVLVLATMPLFYGGAQYANLDMLVAACIAGAILLVAHAALSREAGRPHRGALALGFAAAACGLLAKGLIGAVLPMLVLLGWGLATGRAKRLASLMLWPPGWLVFIAIAAPWLIAMQQRFPDFGHYFFVVQHFQRFASAGFNNPQPWWFYPLVLFAATLPWSPWLLARVRSRAGLRDGNGDLRALMLVWLVVVTVFFSLPASKLVGYILPVLPPLAFLVADALGGLGVRPAAPGDARAGRAWRHLPRATVAIAATACVAIAAAAHFYQPKSLAALAERLRVERVPGEPVVFLDNYYYDLPFYARLDTPVFVADRWAGAEMAKDSWRRELGDAERFAPAASQHRLLKFVEIDALLRSSASAWIVGPWPSTADTPWLMSQEPIYRQGSFGLWHVVGAAKPAAPGIGSR
jgi:4-amino-4-deoxy-L-arabinose transferase-like glycosyltransferase